MEHEPTPDQTGGRGKGGGLGEVEPWLWADSPTYFYSSVPKVCVIPRMAGFCFVSFPALHRHRLEFCT